MYCNDKLINWFLELGVENPVSWFWQHEWDGVPGVNPDHPAAHIHQVEADKRQVGGVGVDVNRILKDDFGQWSQSDGGPVYGYSVPCSAHPVDRSG